ncbi:transcriptional regulator [Salmonella enterica subsp. enterica]|uniref:Transcriptional regulator n=1 Tax=Salmonella enterica I TaxID=59201 RepID=A0A379WN68_SALET|nr:transcriptional regulator [Salmonella enterica subsp. enterica]
MRGRVTTDRGDSRRVNGLMREVIKGHLTEHIVHQSDEARREEDLDVILKVLDSYIK